MNEELQYLNKKLDRTCEFCKERVTVVFDIPKKYYSKYLALDIRVNIPFYTVNGDWFEYARCPKCRHWIKWIS